MLFLFKRKEKQIEQLIQKNEQQDYWSIVRKQFFKNKLAVWGLRIFYGILFIAIFADFIANEKPIVCKIDGEIHFPVFKQYLVDMGIQSWDEKFIVKKWLEQDYEFSIFPLITYSPNTLDRANSKFKSPFGDQTFDNENAGWHYLGTERIGIDIAAGLIHGSRTAMMVGIVAMSIALLIGLFLGSIAGYYGDDTLHVSLARILLNAIAIFFGFFYVFIVLGYPLTDLVSEGSIFMPLIIAIGCFVFFIGIANLLTHFLKRIPLLAKKITIPADIIVMRLIEIFNSIPLLVLILAIVAIIDKPSVFFVMIILGFVSWTSIAKFTRAELLRIRKLEYIEAAQAFGYSQFRIIFKHALPNALAPVLIAVAFGIASAIIIEAYLSFIGVGIPDDQVTWGSLLNMARDNISAWWIAIFPGTAIFITVTIFNLIGEGLTDALDPKMRE